MKRSLIALLTASIAACSTAPSRQTYDAIQDELAKAAASAARPAKPAAPVPSAVSEALIAPPRPQAAPAEAPGRERFSVSFNEVPAKQFFAAIGANTRYNILVHPDVSGTISATLKNVTLFEALDAIRELYGYDYSAEGNRIVVKPLTMQTRVFHVNYLNGSRVGSSETRVNAGTSTAGQQPTGAPQTAFPNTAPTGQAPFPGITSPYPPTSPTGGTAVGALPGSRVSSNLTSDFWGELRDAIRAIVGVADERTPGGQNGDGRSVVISRQSGVVVVRAMPEELRAVAQYLKAAQLSVERQVILEAKILEVQLNDSFQSGINWASFANILGNPSAIGFVAPGTGLVPANVSRNLSTTLNTTNIATGAIGATTVTAATGAALAAAGNAAGSVFGLAFQTNNFAAMLSFLETQGNVHVLSSPRIATLNNQKAILKVGTDDFFVTKVSSNTQTSTTGTIVTPDVTLQQFFSGVVLDVTPQIDEQDNITLHVHPSVTQVSTVNKQLDLGQLGTLNLPLASSNTSETDSVVRGQNGQIIAIGGLMRQATTNDRSQIPGAGDAPGIGGLFRSTSRVNQKRELVILIKPTIVDSNTNWAGDILESQRRMQTLDPQGGGALR
ncbi:MSHA biogenesis protein MshL [Noviherbaspirillum humi]|uniref:MSHA biogenesis protein MshL n=1 Tax=Noviherbaspirillum humi TaxID=1688639 RepID=A0A239HMA0_9BURK|nr:pilus (MSHA type) biogenesis protein MshL [Noviherbaspirillum humi]SNS82467.1 MSHA biogenesis protein MshL [Noviherbaspirillum humi]